MKIINLHEIHKLNLSLPEYDELMKDLYLTHKELLDNNENSVAECAINLKTRYFLVIVSYLKRNPDDIYIRNIIEHNIDDYIDLVLTHKNSVN